MAVQTITYDDKTYINQNADIPNINKCNDTDMNEIKSVVNNNATELSNLAPIELYSNNQGTSANIILNDDISNYSYYEIIYSRGGNGYSSIKMPTSYLTNVNLMTSFYASNLLRIYTANISISGTTLTRNYSKYINFTASNNVQVSDESALYIYKVNGYK